MADNQGAVSSPAKVTVTITGNPPPVAVADTASTTFNTAVIVGVLGNDSDPNGTLAPATVIVTTGPARLDEREHDDRRHVHAGRQLHGSR